MKFRAKKRIPPMVGRLCVTSARARLGRIVACAFWKILPRETYLHTRNDLHTYDAPIYVEEDGSQFVLEATRAARPVQTVRGVSIVLSLFRYPLSSFSRLIAVFQRKYFRKSSEIEERTRSLALFI